MAFLNPVANPESANTLGRTCGGGGEGAVVALVYQALKLIGTVETVYFVRAVNALLLPITNLYITMFCWVTMNDHNNDIGVSDSEREQFLYLVFH